MKKKILQKHIKNGLSIRAISGKENKSYTTIRYWLKKHNLKTHGSVFAKKTWSDKDLSKAVKNSISIAEVMRKINLTIASSNYGTVKKHIKRLNLSTKHFSGKGHGTSGFVRIPLKEILEGKHPQYGTSKLKSRLIKEKIKKEKCEKCKNKFWEGEVIPLETHHKDGDSKNHKLSNLLLLCPNCRALTNTYCGKNVKKHR